MFIKKSLVLLGTKNDSEKAVLSLERKEDMISGRIRLYNFSSEPQGIVSIGFYNNGKVVKAGLSKKSNMVYEFKLDEDSLTDQFSCAVVNIVGTQVEPMLYGNAEGGLSEDKLGEVIVDIFDKEISAKKVEESLDQVGIDYDEELKSEIETAIDQNFEPNCSTCKYKKCFYENSSMEDEKVKKATFFDEMKGQIDSLFAGNDREEFLEQIIPSSKWVKVEYEESGDYYILGLIYEEDVLKYICYGVPGVYQKNPPKELSGYPVWLPLDSQKRESFGYWISYQDASSGLPVKAVLEE